MSRRSHLPVFAAVALLVTVGVFTAPAEAESPRANRVLVDRVAAVVNDAVILHSDVMMRAGPMAADLQRIADPAERERRLATLQERVLDEMIAEELIIGAAKQAGVEISEQEVNAAIREVREQNQLSERELEEALRAQGYTLAAYREDLERQMLRMRAANMLVRPRVSVTDDDLRARYERMAQRAGAVSRVHLRHLLIEVPAEADEDARREARDRAAELAQRARSGEAFADLAQEYSDDAATRQAGGELGWIDRGSLATEWEDIVFAMDEGETRGPITGPRGLHLFHVDARETDEVPAFDEAKEDLRQQLFQDEMERQTEQWIQELRRGAYVDIKLDS